LRNVVDNAVRHNVNGGYLRIRSNVERDSARLVIENGGAVVDEAEAHALVQPFRRLGTARTCSDSGFGLGLSIVAAVAESHNGRVELHALPTGGLQVILELPLAVRALRKTREGKRILDATRDPRARQEVSRGRL
jgi:hypothetical protein